MMDPRKKATPRLTVPAPTGVPHELAESLAPTSGGGSKCEARKTHSEGEDKAEDDCRQKDVQPKLLLEDIGHLLEQRQLYHPLQVDTSEAVML